VSFIDGFGLVSIVIWSMVDFLQWQRRISEQFRVIGGHFNPSETSFLKRVQETFSELVRYPYIISPVPVPGRRYYGASKNLIVNFLPKKHNKL